MTGEHRVPLDLESDDLLDLGMALDFHILLRAIDRAMPNDATLALEGDTAAPPIREFLLANEAPDPRELIPSSTPYHVFHLPLADDNLGQLRLIAEDYGSFEVAFHLVVYRGDEVLLWAHDAGDGSLLVAESLPSETVETLREALGTSLRPYKPPKRFGWFGLHRVRDD